MTRWVWGLLLGLAFAPAHAHKPSDSYLTVRAEGTEVKARWDIALRDLDYAIGLDANDDGTITWGEVRARHADIAAYALARLTLFADGAQCQPGAVDHLIDNHSDGSYAVLRFTAACPKPPQVLEAAYRLFFELDPQHRGLAHVEVGGQTRSAIFSPAQSRQAFRVAQPAPLAQFLDFGRDGVRHIWIGFDHILFLLSLLLPAVLLRNASGWEPVERSRAAFWDAFKVVTAFTVAHSITLSAAALGMIVLPSRLTESAIAASVVLAALNNLYPLFRGTRWIVAFLFGLIHGFGFATVLLDLGLPKEALLLALVGFNLGVEAGQLVIVGVFLPLAFGLRRTWFYRRATLAGGSALIALLGSIWLIERAFNLVLLPI